MLAHILNGYDISLNTTNYSICKILKMFCVPPCWMCCAQVVSPLVCSHIGWYMTYDVSISNILYNKDIERLYVKIRKALRILWRLPYQTHSALLPHITGIPPLDVGIAKRFFKTCSYWF